MKIQKYVKYNNDEESDHIVYQEDELEIKVSCFIITGPNGNISSNSIDDIVNSIEPNSIKDYYLGFNVMSFNKATEIVISVIRKEFDGQLEPGQKYNLEGTIYISYGYYYNYETGVPYLDTIEIDNDYYNTLDLS